ncbi:MAG: hypothetical protein IJG23_03125 [Clostridia bacterium]|nr:hypothetical protein [Clostridia bacterium]
MPNFLCKHCNTVNQVAPDAVHFTCKKCGVKQVTPSYNEQVQINMLDDVLLSDMPEGEAPKPYISKQFTDLENPEEVVFIIEEETEETARKNNIYYNALSKMGGDDIEVHREALALLKEIRGWKDADELITKCEKTIERLQQEEEVATATAQKKKNQRNLAFGIILLALTIVSVFTLVFILTIYPDMRYRKAVTLAESGDTVQAYELFVDLNGYKDSNERVASLYESYKSEKMASAVVGDTVYFGAYEQDGNLKNGKEDIAWVVLEKSGKKLLLCSMNGLDYQKYMEEKVDTTWETSAMRKWLNSDFVDEAFSKEQAAYISLTDVPVAVNKEYETPYGNATKDRVFLLSTEQVEQYFATEEERLTTPSEYAVQKGVYKSKKRYSGINTCCWLLRNPGSDNREVAYVYYDGTIRYSGASVNTRGATFRPTMWIDLSHNAQ